MYLGISSLHFKAIELSLFSLALCHYYSCFFNISSVEWNGVISPFKMNDQADYLFERIKWNKKFTSIRVKRRRFCLMHVLHTTLNCTGYSHSKEVLLLSTSLLGTELILSFLLFLLLIKRYTLFLLFKNPRL